MRHKSVSRRARHDPAVVADGKALPMDLIVTRAQEDAEAFARRLDASRITPHIAPLLAPRWCDGAGPAATRALRAASAAIFTSRNAVRAVEALVQPTDALRQQVTCFAVGPATAQALRDAGWQRVQQGAGSAAALLDPIAAWANGQETQAPFLAYFRGRTVAFDLAARFREQVPQAVLDSVTVYEVATPRSLQAVFLSRLAAMPDAGVTVMSPRTGQVMTEALENSAPTRPEAPLQLGTATAFTLSQTIADTLNPVHWRQIAVSPRPNSQDFIALIEDFAAHGRF